ncbi:R3H-associated N-terminal domain-containing protein [Xylariomycetidae sp. FL0641]|nr:R3H-associated N-terminal domain-containing protein [Xylariomycetidae sp. FL0641]
MAIYSAVPPPPEFGGAPTATNANGNAHTDSQQQPSSSSTSHPTHQHQHPVAATGVDIEAWTLSALESLSVSSVARGTGAPLSIPLDEHATNKPSVTIQDPGARSSAITPPVRPPSRRDSQRRREALLKGKEGSRQRRRWENDRLMHVPNAQPPQPFDWEPRPTHPVHHVPYQVANVWDLRVRAEVDAKKAVAARRKQVHTRTLGDEHVPGRVPRELFQRAKKIPAIKGWVKSLEEPVRQYLVEREMARDTHSSEEDTEDEEIVFVGRNGSMHDGWKKARREEKGHPQDEGMVFDALGLGDEDGGAFRYVFVVPSILAVPQPWLMCGLGRRWITHSISDYYGLQSRSAFVGNPKRKVVYVGVKELKVGHEPPVRTELPKPLWELC